MSTEPARPASSGRGPFATAMLATFGVLATLALIAIIGYVVLSPLASEGRRITYGWTVSDKASYARALSLSPARADCEASAYADHRFTYADVLAGRPGRSDIVDVLIACVNVK